MGKNRMNFKSVTILSVLMSVSSCATMHKYQGGSQDGNVAHNSKAIKTAVATFEKTQNQAAVFKALKLKADPDGLYRYMVEVQSTLNKDKIFAKVEVTKEEITEYFSSYSKAKKKIESFCSDKSKNLLQNNLEEKIKYLTEMEECYRTIDPYAFVPNKEYQDQLLLSLSTIKTTITGFVSATCNGYTSWTENPYVEHLNCFAQNKSLELKNQAEKASKALEEEERIDALKAHKDNDENQKQIDKSLYCHTLITIFSLNDQINLEKSVRAQGLWPDLNEIRRLTKEKTVAEHVHTDFKKQYLAQGKPIYSEDECKKMFKAQYKQMSDALGIPSGL